MSEQAQPSSSQRGSRRLWWGVAAVGFMALFLLPIPRALERDLVIGALGDRAHVVLLGLATLVFAHWLTSRVGAVRAIVLATAAAIVLGGGIEFLQLLTGRSARWRDFSLDLIGIGIATSWLVYRRWRSRLALAAGLVLVLIVPWQLRYIPRLMLAQQAVRRTFPVLADFSDPHAGSLWVRNNDGRPRVVVTDPPHGRVLEATLPPGKGWTGVTMHGFPMDWSAYRRLVGAIRVVEAPTDSVKVILRVDDEDSHKDSEFALRRFMVGRPWQELSVDLPSWRTYQSQRPLRWDAIRSLDFYVGAIADTVVLQIDDLELKQN